MSNSAGKVTEPVNNALSVASHAGSVPSIATRIIGPTGKDVTSMADIVGLQPMQTQTPRAD